MSAHAQVQERAQVFMPGHKRWPKHSHMGVRDSENVNTQVQEMAQVFMPGHKRWCKHSAWMQEMVQEMASTCALKPGQKRWHKGSRSGVRNGAIAHAWMQEMVQALMPKCKR